MQQTIYEWLGGIAAALVLMEMLLLLLPSGNLKKFTKVIAGIMLATLLISPLSSCAKDRIDTSTFSNIKSSGQKQSLDVYNWPSINMYN